MVDLAAVNLTLDIVLKLLLLVILVMVALLVRHIDRTIKSAENSIESVGDAAEKVRNLLTLRAIYKGLKGGKRKDE